MKKNKLILTICACVCSVLLVVVAVAGIVLSNHKHEFGDAKVYHIGNESIYYTKTCKDGHVQRFETSATISEVFAGVTKIDRIVLDENVTLNQALNIDSSIHGVPEGISLNINLDLNGKTLTTGNSVSSANNSLFTLSAMYGNIEFNISNGKIYSENLAYIFRLVNSEFGKLGLNIDGVECTTKGIQTTPLFVHNECSNVLVTAKNSKFVSQNSTNNNENCGVGVFINSESQFDFENCYFEGGDAAYVKQGTVKFDKCEFQNAGLDWASRLVTSETFAPIGTCLAVDSYTDANGADKFDITIVECTMKRGQSSQMIYIKQTNAEGCSAGINNESQIDIKSCTFNDNPALNMVGTDDVILLPSGEWPESNGNQLWICGNM